MNNVKNKEFIERTLEPPLESLIMNFFIWIETETETETGTMLSGVHMYDYFDVS